MTMRLVLSDFQSTIYILNSSHHDSENRFWRPGISHSPKRRIDRIPSPRGAPDNRESPVKWPFYSFTFAFNFFLEAKKRTRSSLSQYRMNPFLYRRRPKVDCMIPTRKKKKLEIFIIVFRYTSSIFRCCCLFLVSHTPSVKVCCASIFIRNEGCSPGPSR